MEALYIGIKNDILAKIKDGTYEVGKTIPTELELAEYYGVSRPTVRQALQILVNAGYLDKRKRRGTIVRQAKIEQGFATHLRSFDDEMRLLSAIPRTHVIMCVTVEADEEVAEALEIETGAEVMKLVRLRYADDLPNVLVVTYVPLYLYAGIEETDFVHESLYMSFRRFGNPVVQAKRRLEVTKADLGTSAVLNMEEGAPIFLFHTIARDEKGRAIEYSIASYRGESNVFEFNTQLFSTDEE